MSNQVDMFKYYASQLNLTKPQLEAVTDCFKACFEAEGVQPAVTEQPDNVNVAKKHVPFDDSNLDWSEQNKSAFELPSFTKNSKGLGTGSQLSAKDKSDLAKLAASARDGQHQNNVYQVEKMQKENAERQKVMQKQAFLNKALGINLAVDGIRGPKTIAAEKQYAAMQAGVQNRRNDQQMNTAYNAEKKYAGTPAPKPLTPPKSAGTEWALQTPSRAPRYSPVNNEWNNSQTSSELNRQPPRNFTPINGKG